MQNAAGKHDGWILEHEQQTGINLIGQVFDNLTAKQIKQLSLKTDIQRTDSTLISSNIRKYSRIQLLIEVLIRLERILDETDKQLIGEQLQAYLKTKPTALAREAKKSILQSSAFSVDDNRITYYIDEITRPLM